MPASRATRSAPTSAKPSAPNRRRAAVISAARVCAVRSPWVRRVAGLPIDAAPNFHTDRVGGLVLTNCDAFEQFPPRFFAPLFTLARSRVAVWTVAQQTRLRAVRHSPLGFGPLLNRPLSASLTRGWIQPLLDSPAIRRDVTRFARGMQRTELA